MILHGDVLEQLRPLASNSVHCVVTSPPYWSLRDYHVPPTIWGGDPACPHAWTSAGTKEGYGGKKKWQHSMTNEPDSNGRGEPRGGKKRSRLRSDNPEGWNQIEQGQFCDDCGAWRGCLGLEPTIELYVAHLVTVFEEVRRVLRKDGTCWLNIGDSYADSGRGGNPGVKSGLQGSTQHQDESKKAARRLAGARTASGLKSKDLCLVPFRVALALQAAGWYVRNDAIWSKTNPMPESARDRLTKSHEYIFVLTKSEKYYFDAHAIREGVTGTAHARGDGLGRKARATAQGARIKQNNSFSAAVTGLVSSRNRRTVWTFPTSPYKGAHFATFPSRLVEPCILAGTSEHGCCSVCGAPYKRLVKLGAPIEAQKKIAGADASGGYRGKATKAYAGTGAQNPSAVKASVLNGMRERITVGWQPTCKHTLNAVEPCVVLDPFGGTGTTGMVAAKHGRDFILIELSAANIALTHDRLATTPTRREDVPA